MEAPVSEHRPSVAVNAGALALVAALYTAVAVVWTWPLATHLGTHTSIRANVATGLARNDQLFSISAAARNAAAIRAGEWWRLIHWRTCYPTPKAATLGEHAIELGILALPGYLVTGNPVVAYNTALLLLLLVAGLSTFCLVRHWTGSAAAGFFAGLAFAFHPEQIDDLVHPFVMGIHWLPLVLFAFDRLLETGRIRFALLLATAGTLQAWVGSYPLLTFVTFAGPYGGVRLLQMRRTLDTRRFLLLALAVGVVALGAGLVLVQYAGGHAWGVRRRQLILVPFSWLVPGGAAAVGGMTLVLAALLIGLRGRKPSPVPAIVAGGLCCVVLVAGGPLWPGGPRLPGLYLRLADHVWILGIARVPGAVRIGAYFAVPALAGIALGRILALLTGHRVARLVLATTVCGLLLVEYFDPIWSRRVYRTPPTVVLVPRAPDPATLAAYRAFDTADPAGPILDIPFDNHGSGVIAEMPDYTYLAAYHGHETPACFTSHIPASYHDVDRMVEHAAAAQPGALVELAAAGLRNLVVHQGGAPGVAHRLAGVPGVRMIHRSDQAAALRITTPVSPHHDPGRLESGRATLRWFGFKGYWDAVVDLEVHNRDAHVWALPHPVQPLALRTRWIDANGRAVTPWSDQAAMLPLAIAGHASAPMRIPVGDPPARCRCRPEIKIPEIGWHVGPEAVDVSGWAPRRPRPRAR